MGMTIGNVHVVHDYVLNMGNAVSNYKDIGLDIDQYSNACVEHYKKQLEAGLSFDTKAKHFCGIGNNFLYITAKGLLKICPSVRDEYNIGNIFENSIENCWNSEQAETASSFRNMDACLHRSVLSFSLYSFWTWPKGTIIRQLYGADML